MKYKKKIIITLTAGLTVGIIFYFGIGIFDYLEYRSVAEASTGMPAQDGGKISLVREPCILDTPASDPVTCAISCPMVTSAVGTACTGYIELDTVGQHGTPFIAAPVGFVYRGGGTHPTAGMDFLYGGASNIAPYVIGIPGVAASRVQKLVDVFKYVIAGFKN